MKPSQRANTNFVQCANAAMMTTWRILEKKIIYKSQESRNGKSWYWNRLGYSKCKTSKSWNLIWQGKIVLTRHIQSRMRKHVWKQKIFIRNFLWQTIWHETPVNSMKAQIFMLFAKNCLFLMTEKQDIQW